MLNSNLGIFKNIFTLAEMEVLWDISCNLFSNLSEFDSDWKEMSF